MKPSGDHGSREQAVPTPNAAQPRAPLCTAGKREDFDRYHEVPAWGLAQGLRVPPSVKLYLQYGTTAVRGRSGPGRVWLASPPTVMASALAGELISFAGLRQRHAKSG